MVNSTFIEQSAPDIRRKLQKLDGVLGMNPSQLVGIGFKVYNAWKARKVKQAAVFLVTGRQGQRKKQNPKGRRRGPIDINQCAYCKEEGHWRRKCPKLTKRKKKK